MNKQSKNKPLQESTPPVPVLPKKPTMPSTFKRPPVVNTFSQGAKIRQDQRRQFFSRTRRGSI